MFADWIFASVVTDNWVMFAPVLTFIFRTFAKTALTVWRLAVTRLDDTRLAWPAVKYVTFAPVLTFRLRRLLVTTFRLWILAVTRLDDEMFARLVTVSCVMFAPVLTFRFRTFAN